MNSFLGNFYRHLAVFSGHTALDLNEKKSTRGFEKMLQNWRLTALGLLEDNDLLITLPSAFMKWKRKAILEGRIQIMMLQVTEGAVI